MTSTKNFLRIPTAALFAEPSVWVLLAVNLIPLAGVFFWDWDLFTLMVLYWMETAMIGFFQLIKILVYQPVLAVFLIPFFTFHFGMFMTVHFIFISSIFGPPWAKAVHASIFLILNRLLFQEGLWVPALALFVSHGVSFLFHGIKRAPASLSPDSPLETPTETEPLSSSGAIPVHPIVRNPSTYHSTDDWKSTIDSTPVRPLKEDIKHPVIPQKVLLEKLSQAKTIKMDRDLMTDPYLRVILMHVTIIFGAMLTFALGTSKAAFTLMIALKITADLFSHANVHRLGEKPSKT